MANEQDRLQLSRRASAAPRTPVKDMPRLVIPERFKRHPEDRAAWTAFENSFNQMQDVWRKTLTQGESRVVGVGGGGTGGGTTVINNPGPPTLPPVEPDLHAIYLMEFIWA